MVINLSQGRWFAFILGAIDGLLYTGASLLYERFYDYIELFLWQGNAANHGFNIAESSLRDPIWYWYGMAGWHIILFSLASYFVHRYWSHVKSIFWLWQMIGISAVTGFYLFRLCFTLLDNYLAGRGKMYEFVSSSEARLIPISIVVAIITNLIFASLIRFSLKHYRRQKTHLYR